MRYIAALPAIIQPRTFDLFSGIIYSPISEVDIGKIIPNARPPEEYAIANVRKDGAKKQPSVDKIPRDIPNNKRDLWLYLTLMIPIVSAVIIATIEFAVLICFVTPIGVPNV